MQLTIDLPPREELIARNRRRWAEVLADRALAGLPYRVETNAHGTLLMTPPPSGDHSHRQSKILLELDRRLGGQALAGCPVSTVDGVRAADVGWYSEQRFAQVQGQIAFEIAPEICVEVLSPANTDSEMKQKKQLYFEAGAEEVWFCQQDGGLEFYTSGRPGTPSANSRRCPEFPTTLGELQ